MDNQYSICIAWSDDDECFVATIPEFPLLSAFGETQEEAAADAKTVLEMALESLREDSIQPPEPKKTVQQSYSGQVRLRIPKSLHRDLVVSAKEDGVSLNTYMVTALTKHYTAQTVNRDVSDKIELMGCKSFHEIFSDQQAQPEQIEKQ